MSDLFGTPEENEKFIEESIARLGAQIEEEKLATHHRIQRIEHDSKQRIRDAQRDFMDRVEPMRRELDALVKAAGLKHSYSTVPPVLISLDDAMNVSIEDLRKR